MEVRNVMDIIVIPGYAYFSASIWRDHKTGKKMSYKIFSADHDEILTSDQLIDMASRWVVHPEISGSNVEEGAIEATRNYISDRFHVDFEGEFPDSKPVTLLLDASGSMRGNPISSVVGAVTALGDAMHASGRPFEILGFTTKAWKGGKPGDIYREIPFSEREEKPGRVSQLRNMVFKAMEELWPEKRDSLLALLIPGVLKENVDGEAVLWAKSRIEARNQDEHLILIGDGVPSCDATSMFNGRAYLKDHYHEAVSETKSGGVDISSVLFSSQNDEPKSHPDFDRMVAVNLDEADNLHGRIAEAVFETIFPDGPRPDGNEPSIG